MSSLQQLKNVMATSQDPLYHLAKAIIQQFEGKLQIDLTNIVSTDEMKQAEKRACYMSVSYCEFRSDLNKEQSDMLKFMRIWVNDQIQQIGERVLADLDAHSREELD